MRAMTAPTASQTGWPTASPGTSRADPDGAADPVEPITPSPWIVIITTMAVPRMIM